MLRLGKFKLGLRKSKVGGTLFAVYVFLGLVALGVHLYSVNTNPGDTGLSALYLYFLARPWIDMFPEGFYYTAIWGYLVYPAALLMVGLNAGILYLVFGGLKIERAGTKGT